ncbi:IclR family transcriptional regulator [Lentzea flaviverrucosa]|uniref:IclR family transcriptional regulator n=1 Tax=Lentzea flaviverrucosa TaxID=200379 RepID=UPI00147694B2|nr:IclR family transcriptional regulator [Lentzea flaviverrucosa]
MLTVLQAFGAHDGSASTAELARHTELPKSTVHRMIGFLRTAGLVDVNDKGYVLTARMAELSAAVPSRFSRHMREMLMPGLTDLHGQSGEAVQLAALSGDVVRTVACVHGRRSAGLMRLLRNASPLSCTAAGKVLLAGSPLLVSRIDANLEQHTSATITSISRLHEELAGVRKFGVAFDRGEWRSGLAGVAAPVWGPDRVLLGAISVVGPSARLRVDEVAPKVRKAAEIATWEMQSAACASASD